jgi:hypothetical protein
MLAIVAVVWLVSAVPIIPGTPTMAGRPPIDKEFPTVHPVSGTPTDWVTTVCEPHAVYAKFGNPTFPAGVVFLFPNKVFNLPRSEGSAVCSARYRGAYDSAILIAEYRSEDVMQSDLADNDIQWYCFAAVGGSLFVMATRAEERVMGANGLNASPALAPLVNSGFIVYSDPGR